MKFNVPDMSCGHCTSAIETAIKSADTAANVACDLPSRTVAVGSSLSVEQVSEILKKEGYEAVLAG
ncbi:heavy-metal-associated domain-containing protein [Donghicola mangrovi]|uniref:Heavy-metal-associated domain-containing protein n=1 Tax=Donghicola mangrovi TaxID=2729614 RepID=A0A850Q7S0_9RHOB|nr:heavy-metal-associated domain-containing protein [Donghicola mangrovi]NVO25186.1 heavy-metal-associated domain-containing protein [Donghicola mangrovi]